MVPFAPFVLNGEQRAAGPTKTLVWSFTCKPKYVFVGAPGFLRELHTPQRSQFNNVMEYFEEFNLKCQQRRKKF
jgi:hypothetical protein